MSVGDKIALVVILALLYHDCLTFTSLDLSFLTNVIAIILPTTSTALTLCQICSKC